MSAQSADPHSLMHVKPDWTDRRGPGWRIVLSPEAARFMAILHQNYPKQGAFREHCEAALNREVVALTKRSP